ncbi:MAG: glycosyltransferase [Ruminococcus sp.]|nr:glycosyltransferase [Ruminococcus sp.]
MAETYGKVSVIMAVYNCEDTVADAIDSILNQTYSDIELVICEDCSADNTYQVVKQYADKYNDKIILIRNEKNSKLPASLNHCLKYATGKYIARMDGDDISYPDRIERQVSYLVEHPDIDLVGTGMAVFDGEKIVGQNTSPEHVDKYNLVHKTCFCHATILTYKYVYDKLGGYSLEPRAVRVEDVDLWFRFFAAGFKGANLPDLLYRVTDNANAASRRKFSNRINAMKTLFHGYRLLHFPIYYYPIALTPVLKGLAPKFVYNFFRGRKFKKHD